MITKSLRLNLKLAYQLTQRMMICPSKCRPLNSASTGTNRSILSSSPDHGLFAPEPMERHTSRRRSSTGAELHSQRCSRFMGYTSMLRNAQCIAIRVFEPRNLPAAGRGPDAELVLLHSWIALE